MFQALQDLISLALSRVYSASHPLVAGICSSTPTTLIKINGWMDGDLLSPYWCSFYIFITVLVQDQHCIFSVLISPHSKAMTSKQHDWSVAILSLEQHSYDAGGYQIHHVSVKSALLLLSLSQVSAESKESSLLQVIMLLKIKLMTW